MLFNSDWQRPWRPTIQIAGVNRCNPDSGLKLNSYIALPPPSAASGSEAGLADSAVAARLLSKEDKPASKPKPKKPTAKTGHDESSRESNSV